MVMTSTSDEATIRANFDKFDADHNESIDQSELTALLRHCGKNPTNDQIVDFLNQIDQN